MTSGTQNIHYRVALRRRFRWIRRADRGRWVRAVFYGAARAVGGSGMLGSVDNELWLPPSRRREIDARLEAIRARLKSLRKRDKDWAAIRSRIAPPLPATGWKRPAVRDRGARCRRRRAGLQSNRITSIAQSRLRGSPSATPRMRARPTPALRAVRRNLCRLARWAPDIGEPSRTALCAMKARTEI